MDEVQGHMIKKPKFSGPGIVCHKNGTYSWSDGNRDVFFSEYKPNAIIINFCWYLLSNRAKRLLGHVTIHGDIVPPNNKQN